jgi:polyisoprenoid-binding protein YceI
MRGITHPRRQFMAKWNIDPAHSVASFSIRHMMITNIRGQSTGITGTIEFEPPDIEKSSVEARIAVTSLSTGNKKRDDHLFSSDFFDAEKYPDMIFRGTVVEKTGTNRGKIAGDLTIHGITLPVTMEVEYFGPVKSPQDLGGETSLGFTASFTINREDFGVAWNMPAGNGNFVVGKDVLITLDIEADLM